MFPHRLGPAVAVRRPRIRRWTDRVSPGPVNFICSLGGYCCVPEEDGERRSATFPCSLMPPTRGAATAAAAADTLAM
ncbi:hypothetical protein E2C01_069267 [Portunus trituberculatus]|uniref:Uncharacterized protein n=1 Tax=Portunus trituberculatus TaxID=210409 RepID=A0A5B7I1Q4_PORTR|nr:hypothetical protein [Portunus trituberculatus]